MSTPTEYQILRERHDRLREGIAALADEWETSNAASIFTTYFEGFADGMKYASDELRALLDQEDA